MELAGFLAAGSGIGTSGVSLKSEAPLLREGLDGYFGMWIVAETDRGPSPICKIKRNLLRFVFGASKNT
jgi:hypothetical protein